MAEAQAVKRAVIIMTRYPEPGRCKTRLIPALGPEGACNVHRIMAERTLRTCMDLLQKESACLLVFYAGGDASLMKRWMGDGIEYQPQSDGNLGTRMSSAFKTAFSLGFEHVIMTGTDCPGLSRAILAEAFKRLERHGLVLGPATDGGYYLIGLKGLNPHLFEDIPWGTSRVLDATLEKAGIFRLETALLEELPDIDRPEDLDGFIKCCHRN